ncbi:MAG: T9SS type A sorting domain-containing protein, partial [candidate division WOR-3 bacterium]|nr:T9SS type A sorting domain-containing protein [candidate division WOR-3 bacterium]
DDIYGGFIKYMYIQQKTGNFVYVNWTDTLVNDFELDVSVPDTGRDGKIPLNTPVMTHYYNTDYVNYYPFLAFIDTDSNYTGFMWDAENLHWSRIYEPINLSGNKVYYPTVNEKLERTYFVWSEWEGDNSKLLTRKMENGILSAECNEVITKPETISNMKMKEDSFFAYTLNNVIKTNPAYYDIGRKSELIYSSKRNIHSLDFCIIKQSGATSEKYYGCFAWVEGNDSMKILNTKQVEYKEADILPIALKTLSDFNDTDSSILRNLIPGNPPIESVTMSYTGLDPALDYMVKLITSAYNPKHPQMISIDGETMNMIYGQAGSIDTTEVWIPQEMLEDRRIDIALDRVKGNPNRKSEVLLYEMNLTDGLDIASQRKLVLNEPDPVYLTADYEYRNSNPYLNYTIHQTGNCAIDIYDITGRSIYSSKSFIEKGKHILKLQDKLHSGVYFVHVSVNNQTAKSKMVILQ